MTLAEEIAAYLSIPTASRGAAGTLSRRQQLNAEMSYDGTHPLEQQRAAMQELAEGMREHGPIMAREALGFVPLLGTALDARDAVNAYDDDDVPWRGPVGRFGDQWADRAWSGASGGTSCGRESC